MKFSISFFKYSAMTVAALCMASCSDDNDDDDDSDDAMQKAVAQYVNGVVIPTYTSLADESINLADACEVLRSNATQANVKAACDKWIAARKYWEQSEAFLYGAAADYNIDPHIDSWPLDKAQLDIALSNSALMESFAEGELDGLSTLGYGLLGFHAVEYVIFRDGHDRSVSEITENELVYCSAVAKDLRNQCIRLEASWRGIDNVGDAKKSILEDEELEPTNDYGEMMKTAGLPGNSHYKTQLSAIIQILQGAADISDEVGNTKITDPVSSGNVLDVESWYSWNSIADFADNMRSVQHAYCGNLSDKVNDNSVSNIVRAKNAKLDDEVKSAISKAISEIEAMPAPFRNHLTEAETNAAKAACNDALDKIENAIELLQESK